MLANILNTRIQILEKVATTSAHGQDVIWKPVRTCWARITPLSTKTIAEYQQQHTDVSHSILMATGGDMRLGINRAYHAGHTYEPAISAVKAADCTTVVVRQLQ